MANNRSTKIVLLVLALMLFFAGGLLLGRLTHPSGEVADFYVKDGESIGIFDQIPAEDLAAGAAIAEQGLQEEYILPEDRVVVRTDPSEMAKSQLALTDLSEIAGVAPRIPTPEQMAQEQKASAVELDLTGHEVAAVQQEKLENLPDMQESKITMIVAPVKYFLVKNTDEYKDFKTRARGSYPAVDFNKQMLVVLESDSNLPDNVFEIVSAQAQDGQLLVTYRVNVLGLSKKVNSHTVIPVNKTNAPVELKQVL